MSAIEGKVTKSYATHGGRNVGAFTWAALIEFLLSLANCKLPAVAQRWAKKNPEAAKEMLDAQLKEAGVFMSGTDRKAAVEAAYETFCGLTKTELRALRDETEEDE